LTHGIIFEPDTAWRPLLERALASLYWTVANAGSLEEVGDILPEAWAAVLAVESGDLDALEAVRQLRKIAPSAALCVLVDELSPEFDRQLYVAGVDAVFAKPVQETEIVEALVAGFMARRG
jgi:DNA-binding NarL/FixJ family response regulator